MPEQSMADRLKRMGSRLTVDDGFHVPTTLDYFWTETNWFALVIPDHKITIQLYPFFQTNLDVCSAGVYMWDDTGDQWWNCLYAKNFWHLPFPRQPLYNLQLPNGLRYKTLESLQKYAIGFDCPDGEDVHLDVVWEGIVPANRGATGNHLDQPGRITGTLVLARGDDRDRRGRLPGPDLVTAITVRPRRRPLRIDGLHVGHLADVG